MIEVILTLLGIAFLWAYLYSKSPERNTAFRLLFLGMSLWTTYLLVWVTFNNNTVTIVNKYNETESYVGKDVWNTTLSEPVRNTLTTYLDVTTWVIYAVIALLFVFFIWNLFTEFWKRK